MALNIKNTIIIGGEEQLVFTDMFIYQAVNQHHKFELTINWVQFEEQGEAIIGKSKSYIGQPIEITFCNSNSDIDMQEGYFEGVITEVESIKSKLSSVGDHILLKGYSPTIVMDGVACCKSFEEKTLADITNEVFSAYSLPLNNNPLNANVQSYIVQYNKSDFEFLQQLAIRKGEWFYYNGAQVFWGVGEGDVVELRYGKDLTDFSIKLQTTPKKMACSTHDYIMAKDAKASLKKGTNLTGYYSFMSDQSEALYTKEGLVSYYQNATEGNQQADLDAMVEMQNESTVGNTVVLIGQSRNTGLKPGSKIKILHKVVDGETDYGNYIVTQINHTNSEAGNYTNSFEAIPEGVVYPPYGNILLYPTSEPQRALVADNNDPQKIGRIRVQFSWQTNSYSPWIRITQPHSGSNKGFHFIPETGEEVMVGFEGGNVELPFVIGSLYNGSAQVDEFTTDTNDVKVIRTRSGHTIEMNDSGGQEKINIYDNQGSIITFDTANKSLIINSVENIDIAAKNINISAEENIVMGAKSNIDIAAEGDLNNQAKGNVAIQSDGDTSVNSGGAATIAAKTDAAMNGQNVSVEGKMKAGLVGTQTTVEGKMTAVQGASGKVEVM